MAGVRDVNSCRLSPGLEWTDGNTAPSGRTSHSADFKACFRPRSRHCGAPVSRDAHHQIWRFIIVSMMVSSPLGPHEEISPTLGLKSCFNPSAARSAPARYLGSFVI